MKLLVCYDGSTPSKRAFRHAQKLAALMAAGLDVATVVVRHSTDQSEEIEKAEKELAVLSRSCKDRDIECRTHLLIRGDSPGEALVRFAAENGCDQIVIGIRKTSRVGKLLLGSNAQVIILSAGCPVVSVR